VVIVFLEGGSFIGSSPVGRLCRLPARPGGSTSPLSLRARSHAAVRGSRGLRCGIFTVSQVKLVGLLQSLAAFPQIGYAPVRPHRRARAPARRSGRAARTASSRHLFRDLQRAAMLLPSALLLLLLPAPLPCAPVQASTSSALGSRELRPLPCALLRRLRAAPPWRPLFSPPPVCAPHLRAPRSLRPAAALPGNDAAAPCSVSSGGPRPWRGLCRPLRISRWPARPPRLFSVLAPGAGVLPQLSASLLLGRRSKEERRLRAPRQEKER
jgi:hypothetical protein